MGTTEAKTPKMRELFIEELADVRGGSQSSDPCCTTMACCEEGPFGCCSIGLDDIIRLDP